MGWLRAMVTLVAELPRDSIIASVRFQRSCREGLKRIMQVERLKCR